jgi:radical SAM protein with 4Fe4S-binding SPASM domain
MEHMSLVDLPYALQIELTSNCNLHCKMCPLTITGTESSITPGAITERVWSEVVALAREVGQVVVAGFGEPLLQRNCLDLLRELEGYGVHMSMATNGHAITPAIAQQLNALRYLFHINVSIDSPDPATYAAIRGGALERALRGLRNLMAAIDDPQRVTVSSVALASSIGGLAAFPPILAELGVKTYVVQGVLDYTLAAESEGILGRADVAAALAALRNACTSAGVTLVETLPERSYLELTQPEQARERYYTTDSGGGRMSKCCTLPWDLPYVDKDGRVYICCYAAGRNTGLLGNVHAQSLREIWHSAAYHDVREGLRTGASVPTSCRQCTLVPNGEHPFQRFQAEVLLDQSQLRGTALRLLVRNVGTQAWTHDDGVRIGTTRRRNRHSMCYHPSWMNADRIGTFREPLVRPGDTATFVFAVTPPPPGAGEYFQLVVDGVGWLPNTQFVLAAESDQE